MQRETLHSWIHYWASEASGKPAVFFDEGEIDHITFSDEVRSLGAALALRLDLRSIVLLRFPVIAEAFAAFYGCAEAGMLPLIIGDEFPPSDLSYLVENTGAKALMLDDKTASFPEFLKQSEAIGIKVFYCGAAEIDNENAVSLREAVAIGNPSYRGPINSGVNPLYTVKYTGIDEYATITHANVLSSTDAYIDYFGLSTNDVFLALRSRDIPFHELSALPIMTGTPIIVMKNRRPMTIYENIERYGVTTLQIDDEYAAKLATLKRKRPESLQHIIWYRSIYDGPPAETYGDIWDVPVTRLSGCFAISGAGFATFGDAPPLLLGTALPHIEPALIDTANEPVNLGNTGILKLTGSSVAERGIVGFSEEVTALGEFVTGINALESPRNFFSYAP
jgi:acyl-coenzyme A synthetase/AMP-(fatty) acid ligase